MLQVGLANHLAQVVGNCLLAGCVLWCGVCKINLSPTVKRFLLHFPVQAICSD